MGVDVHGEGEKLRRRNEANDAMGPLLSTRSSLWNLWFLVEKFSGGLVRRPAGENEESEGDKMKRKQMTTRYVPSVLLIRHDARTANGASGTAYFPLPLTKKAKVNRGK